MTAALTNRRQNSTRIPWTAHHTSINITTDPRDLQNGIDDSTYALAGNQTCCNCVAVNVKGFGVALFPKVRREGSNDHGKTVDR